MMVEGNPLPNEIYAEDFEWNEIVSNKKGSSLC